MSETRDKILRAAAGAFAASGFHRATVKQVAQHAGVNEVTVFRHFPEKQQLYSAALKWKLCASGLVEELGQVIRTSDTPAQFVAGFCSRVIAMTENDPDLRRILQFALLELGGEKRQVWYSFSPLIEEFDDKMHRWIATGKIREVEPEQVFSTLVGFGLSEQWLERKDKEARSAQERAASHTDLSLFGLLPR